MHDVTWALVRNAIIAANRNVPRKGRKPVYTDCLIVKMYFWSVYNDRPLRWASDRKNLKGAMRCREIPSYSQFCKRLKTERIQAMINRVNERMAASDKPVSLAFIDGKPMPVSESTRDPDARNGRGNGRFSRGYKVHALGDEHGRIMAFHVTGMNAGEPTVARKHLVSHVPPGTLVLADGNYDGQHLYTEIGARDATLLTPLKGNKRTEQAYRNTTPERRAAMERWRDEPEQTRKLMTKRSQIERIFSAISCFGGGLQPLPSWVRRLERVTRWITAKIAIYHARLIAKDLAS